MAALGPTIYIAATAETICDQNTISDLTSLTCQVQAAQTLQEIEFSSQRLRAVPAIPLRLLSAIKKTC